MPGRQPVCEVVTVALSEGRRALTETACGADGLRGAWDREACLSVCKVRSNELVKAIKAAEIKWDCRT